MGIIGSLANGSLDTGSLATGSMLESMFLGPEEEEGRFGVDVDSNMCEPVAVRDTIMLYKKVLPYTTVL